MQFVEKGEPISILEWVTVPEPRRDISTNGGMFSTSSRDSTPRKATLDHQALKKTFKHLHGAASSTLVAKDTGCCRVADLFYTDTLFVPIPFAARKKINSAGRIKICLGPKLKLRHLRSLQPCGLLDEVNHTRIHHLHQWSGIQSNTKYENSQWNQRS